MSIKVATQGNEVKEIKFFTGMTLKDAFQAAEIKPGRGATITVNGDDVSGFFKGRREINDKDIVVITPKISNG